MVLFNKYLLKKKILTKVLIHVAIHMLRKKKEFNKRQSMELILFDQ